MQRVRRCAPWLRRHDHIAATLFFIALLSVYFAPFFAGDQLGQSYSLLGETPWHAAAPAGVLKAELARNASSDAAHTFYPALTVARDQVHAGHVPLWDPYAYAGTTLLGDMQSALLFPLTWLAFVLPLQFAWGLIAILKLLVAGIGTYALTRQLGIGRRGGLVAGTVFMLAAPNIVYLQSPQSTVFILLPWLILTTDRLYRRPGIRHTVPLALVVVLTIVAGHPESAVLDLGAAAVYLLALVLLDRASERPLRERARTLLWWLTANIWGVLGAAAAVVPFLQAFWPSADREVHHLQSGSHVGLYEALQYVLPTAYGDGKPRVWIDSPLPFITSVAGYFGIVALLLALVAAYRLRADARAKALIVLAVVTGMTLFGVPPLNWITATPPLDSVVVERVYVILAVIGAVGAGAGVASLSRYPLSKRTLVRLGFGGVAVVALWTVLAEASGHLPAPSSVKLEAVARAAGFFALGIGCLALLGRARGFAPVLFVTAVCVLDVAYLQNFNVWLPPALAHPPEAKSIAFLQRQPASFRISTVRPATRLDQLRPIGSDVLVPMGSAPYGIESIEGHDPPVSNRWALFQGVVLRQKGFSRERLLGPPQPVGAGLTGLRMMNTRYYMAVPGAKPPNPAFRTVYAGADATVFEDPGALPRAYVVPATTRVSDEQALTTLSSGGFDPRRVALVPPGTPALPPGRRTFVPTRTESLGPDHTRVTVPGGAGGWLVLANAYAPQWRATVDGHSVPLRATDYVAMGVPIPPGRHTVDFELSRDGFNVGILLSGLALVGMAAALIVERRRRSPTRKAA
jgi:hypothetical protein